MLVPSAFSYTGHFVLISYIILEYVHPVHSLNLFLFYLSIYNNNNIWKIYVLIKYYLILKVEMAQKLLNSDLAELINKMKLAQQYVLTSLQQDYKKQMLTAAHALAVDAKNLLDVIDQARLKMIHAQSRGSH